MNFVAQLEDYLRDLGTEARKKHPGVKEASERAILKLRSLQNNYVSAVRKATGGEKHPDKTLFRSSDLLHPFLLAANYPNASPKLLDTSFKAMKTLMEANAICPGDGMNLVRVWMIQAQVVVSYSTKELPTTGNPSEEILGSNQSASGSSWFGGFLASSTENAKTTNAVSTKTAVSSSHGQAGSGRLNSKDLEKIALDILSCLLQLLELRDLPVSTEQWIQSVTLCCLLHVPLRQTVRQAAQSTLPQVLTLLVRDKEASSLAESTWEDLLACTSKSYKSNLKGAFSHCRFGERGAPQPPSPSFSLDLMTTLLKEAPFVFTKVGQKTLGMVVQVLHQNSINTKASPLEFLRVLQFVLVVLQTQAKDWPAECRELVIRLSNPIPLATESLRKQEFFEDGFIYRAHNKNLSQPTQLETLQRLPPTILWKAALCLEALKAMVEEKSLQPIWTHDDVVVQLMEAVSDFCTIGASCQDHMQLVVLACLQERGLSYSAETLASMEPWRKGKHKDDTYILGDALLIGLTVIIRMVDGLDETILDPAFAPALSVLQHYLKRFPASENIVKRSLEGYFTLGKVSLKLPLLRRALLTSLCKLSLPRWGIHDPTCKLKDHHVAALICLMRVIHRFHDDIGSEWSIVMRTFQELSVLAIASPTLSDNAYVGALSISAVYSRFAAFSTCLSDDSLAHFVEGLREVSLLDQTRSAIANPMGGAEALRIPEKSVASMTEGGQVTIGEKIMSVGMRAIYGNNEGAQEDDVPLTERTKNSYYHDFHMEFSRRLATSKYPVRADQVPFSFSLLADVAMTNSFRHSRCGATIFRQLCSIATASPSMRLFPMDTVAMLIMSHVAQDQDFPTSFTGPGRLVYEDPRQNQYLAVETIKEHATNNDVVSQVDLLGPLCECIRDSKVAGVVEAGVEALHSVLESTGHKLDAEAWMEVIRAVASLPSDKRESTDWSNSFAVGFRCLKLIVDDFLNHTDSSIAARTSLLDCCSSFGSSRHDVNTSLTAIGLLWTIADQDAGTVAIDRALSKLVILSSDVRAEVRNCSVNTLFSCIVGRGQSFNGEQWKACIIDMVFGVYDLVSSKLDNDAIPTSSAKEAPSGNSRYRVSVHHSRDSTGKQWVSTQALVLRGLCRVLRSFFSQLLDTTDGNSSEGKELNDTPWFDGAWSKILSYAFDAATQVGGRDTLDLRNSGVGLLVLCNQLSCKAGMQAAITPARVGTNMEVVNGALRSVRTAEKSSGKISSGRARSAVTEMWRENLFLDAFDVLDSFREHLDSDAASVSEPGLSRYMEPTQVQVLSKFAADLSKLYDCCKDQEFLEDRTFAGTTSFEKYLTVHSPPPKEEDPLVARFVRVIVITATKSSGGPDSRFLSQAQRSCVELLRSMASHGSPEALINLASLSGSSFFSEREPNGKPTEGVDILSHEASNVLHEEIRNSNVSDMCRVLILTRMLSIFLDEQGKEKVNSELTTVKQSYELVIPMVASGLASAKCIEASLADGSKDGKVLVVLLDTLWDKLLISLARMLSPIPNGSKLLIIPHASDLVDLVSLLSQHVPKSHFSEVCAVLSSGASKCMEVAKLLSEKDVDDKGLQRQKEESVNLFAACFSGVCKLQPDDSNLQIIAEQVLSASQEVISGKKDSNRANSEISENVMLKTCLIVCEILQDTQGIERVVIALFPYLCYLVGTEEPRLRQAVAGVLATVDVVKILEEDHVRAEEAEKRAAVAERTVSDLTLELEKVQKEKEILERQLALL